jgi:hypothetical protein
MLPHPLRRDSKSNPPDHPVVPGSILYRALQQVAKAVAKRVRDQSDDPCPESIQAMPKKPDPTRT